MKAVKRTKQFKKDIRLMQKQGKDFGVLKHVIGSLIRGGKLEDRYYDHRLRGDYRDFRECHLEPDWLLIYEASDEVITLRRTGSHAELFKT